MTMFDGHMQKALAQIAERDATITKLRAENAALRDALRRHEIMEPILGISAPGVCRRCERSWAYGQPERHAPGCLAEPKTDGGK